MLLTSCLTAYVIPVTELVEKKNSIKKRLNKKRGFQLYKWKGLQCRCIVKKLCAVLCSTLMLKHDSVFYSSELVQI